MSSTGEQKFRDWCDPVWRAAKRLLRNRTISLLVALSLALGIGVNTAIFSILDAVFLAPLPVHDPTRLVYVYTTDSRHPGVHALSGPNLEDLSRRNTAFEDVAACMPVKVNLKRNGAVEEVEGEVVSLNYFRLLGLEPMLGVLPVPGTGSMLGESTEAPSVQISHKLWKTAFGEDPKIIGRTILLNRIPFTVSAVLEPGYRGLDRFGHADVWAPMSSRAHFLERPEWMMGRRALLMAAIARIKSGIRFEHAAEDAARVGKELAAEYPLENRGRSFGLANYKHAALGPARHEKLFGAALVLMAAAGVVLLISICNAGNVLLARTSIRRREMAVRLAMGATPLTLLRQISIESALLVLAGGALGLLMGIGGRELLWSLRPGDLYGQELPWPFNARVVSFAFLLSLATGILAGILPVWQTLRGNLTGELRERSTIRGARRLRLREALVVAQVALSLIALVGADLFLKSLRNMQQLDPGFDSRNVASFDVNPRRLGIHGSKQTSFYVGLQERLAKIEGVHSVAVSSDSLLGGSRTRRTVLDERNGPSRNIIAGFHAVGLRFFETTDVLILRGRDFTASDGPDAPRVTIVNETMARLFWPDDSPIGRKLRFFGDDSDHVVVGVARDVTGSMLGEPPAPITYVPLLQSSPPMATVHVRIDSASPALIERIGAGLKGFQSELPAAEIVPLAERIREQLWAPRMAAALLTVFGLLALALASIGVYGVTQHLITVRTGEIGVRMAMGASAGDVLEIVLRQGLNLILPGLAIGAVASFALAHTFNDLLFRVSETDIEPYLAGSLLLALVALIATYLPARRAVRMPPAVALREP
jgi:predicted permease